MKLLLDLLFPPSCIGCGALNTPWCERCFLTIRLLEAQSCYICRKPSTGGVTCSNHTVLPTTLNRLLVACPYDANPLLKKAIHALKYHRRSRALAEPLGALLTESSEKVFFESFWRRAEDPPVADRSVRPKSDEGRVAYPSRQKTFSEDSSGIFQMSPAIIPIPLHKTRLKERGFNQAQLLAESLTRQLPHPVIIRTDLLIRTRPTPPQAESKTREERFQNLQQAFMATGSIDPSFTYLLLDDVCATCATLEDACRAMREAGAKEVWGMVVARN